jgi:CheY-like chemotaxis protein
MADKCLLVVEGSPIQCEGLAAVLRQEGYTVVTAADGVEALNYMRKGPPPDLILLDMRVPPPGHYDWHFLQLRKQNPALAPIPVLIVTGLSIASAEWAVGLGAAGFVKKPVEMDLLFAEIRRCCGLSPLGSDAL